MLTVATAVRKHLNARPLSHIAEHKESETGLTVHTFQPSTGVWKRVVKSLMDRSSYCLKIARRING